MLAMRSSPESKPVKLRSACNSCFSAKVRCDGNKEGCSRCTEKRLDCKYSESRVGKVVGKRRKRPLLDSSGNSVVLEIWPSPYARGNLPSPASTEGSSVSSCPDSSWAHLLSYDEQDSLDYGSYDDQMSVAEFQSHSPADVEIEIPSRIHSGLPTPTYTDPQKPFLSPAELELRPSSQMAVITCSANNFVQPTIPASISKSPEPSIEDEETVCIKLLSHLKKHTLCKEGNLDSQLILLKKTNATVGKLLTSKAMRSDYACQLLLSSIVSHLTTLAERLCLQWTAQPHNHTRASFAQYPHHGHDNNGMVYVNHLHQQDGHLGTKESIHMTVNDTLALCSGVGDLLKRKPLNGFQTLGRHESLHIALDQRLKKALMHLS